MQTIVVAETPVAEARFDFGSMCGAQIDVMIAEQDGSLRITVKQLQSMMNHVGMRFSLQRKLSSNDMQKEWRQAKSLDEDVGKVLWLVGDDRHRFVAMHGEELHDAGVDDRLVGQMLSLNLHETFAPVLVEQLFR